MTTFPALRLTFVLMTLALFGLGSPPAAIGLSPGLLDTTFSDNGWNKVAFSSVSAELANAVVVQPDDKVITAGYAPLVSGNDAFTVARWNTDGTLDPSFGSGGLVVVDVTTTNDRAEAVVLQPDGKIVLAGSANSSTSSPTGADFGLARLNADGTVDTSFGSGGVVITSISPTNGGDFAYGVALQSMEKLSWQGVD